MEQQQNHNIKEKAKQFIKINEENYQYEQLLQQKGGDLLVKLENEMKLFRDKFKKEKNIKNLSIIKSDLQNIMKYKLKRGAFRPTLQKLVDSNEEKIIQDISDQVLELVLKEQEKPLENISNIEKCLDLLNQLKGVGPATSSLILSLINEQIPFMSDEYLSFLEIPLNYTKKNLIQFFSEALQLQKELQNKLSQFQIEQIIFCDNYSQKILNKEQKKNQEQQSELDKKDELKQKQKPPKKLK